MPAPTGIESAYEDGRTTRARRAPSRALLAEDLGFLRACAKRYALKHAAARDGAPTPPGPGGDEALALSARAAAEFRSEWWQPLLATLRALRREWACAAPKLLAGFVDRVRAERALRAAPPGTFLVRFSETKPGRLAISFAQAAPPTRRAAPADANPQAGSVPPVARASVQHTLVDVRVDGAATCLGVRIVANGSERWYGSLRELASKSNQLLALHNGPWPVANGEDRGFGGGGDITPKAAAFAQLDRDGDRGAPYM